MKRERVVTVDSLRAELRRAYGERLGMTGLFDATPPSIREYERDPEYRDRVAGECHRLFRARCWICGLSAREAAQRNTRLTTAHIVYPAEPFSEVIEPAALSLSDVVLLCWPCHRHYDGIMCGGEWSSVELLRESAVELLHTLRLQASEDV